MKSRVAIRVEGIGKQYRIGGPAEGYKTLRETLSEAAGAPARAFRSLVGRNGAARPGEQTFWALKDVSFEVNRGEVVGVIGRNGAGKSTLLKVLSRITEPTEGHADILGRVGSLLEVGTGFHPELSGRENIFLNGAILGMPRADIQRRFDEIVAFAEVEKFIDTPVKRYSSGMYLRLAFAVAAHLEPEILLVDEVLAVGDAGFQKKCLGKMRDVTAQGRTVLLVSHNMTAIRSLSTHVLLLSGGRVQLYGDPEASVSAYLRAGEQQPSSVSWDDPASAPGDSTVRIKAVRVAAAGGAGEMLDLTTPIDVEIDYWVLKPSARVHVTLHFVTDHGVVAFTTGSGRQPGWENRPREAGLYRSVCHVPGHLLNEGGYEIKLLAVEDRSRVLFELENVVGFDVKDTTDRGVGSWYGREPGPVRPRLPWSNYALDAAPLEAEEAPAAARD